ncbi:MAG: hypothetical protein HFI33_08780 [Lachnospiraceae bacterium]|nr:hypothetical protein [Lachnospiraceae bacterium]
MRGIKNATRLLGIFICSSILLFLPGCQRGTAENTAAEKMETEKTEEMEQGVSGQTDSWADQVLEVGILADCTNPYTVVAFEIFGREAGKCNRPLVVELHDSRDGYEAQKGQLEWLLERGVDVLLVDMAHRDSQADLKKDLESVDCPVIYFGTRPEEELLEENNMQYIGLSQEEAQELTKALEEERFEESGFRERAGEAGEELLQVVLELVSGK